MPTTSNFGWTTPADTDLVKDGAAAIRTLGNGIDASFLDLKGGTTGQILSKASNTDLDYTWIANDQGDITEVQAGTGISVASGTGPIPVVTNTVATTFDAKGDLVVGTGADTFAKLTVGANNTVLTADSTTATGLKWAAAAGGGKILQVVEGSTTTYASSTSTTFADTNLSASITPSATTSKILVLVAQNGAGVENNVAGGFKLRLLRGATELATQTDGIFGYATITLQGRRGYSASMMYLDSPSTTSATTYKTQFATSVATCQVAVQDYLAAANTSRSSIILMEVGA